MLQVRCFIIDILFRDLVNYITTVTWLNRGLFEEKNFKNVKVSFQAARKYQIWKSSKGKMLNDF